MRVKIATWNMDHWKGVGRDRDHTAKAWQYARDLGADIVLLQEAVPPPTGFEATVFPPRDEPARWHSGGAAAFGAAIAVFGHEATQIESGPLMGDRTARLQQTHAGAFVAAWVKVGEHVLAAVSLYGLLEGKLLDKDTYATTSVHRSLSDLTPLLNMRSKMRVVGGDLNVSTQMKPPDREAHRVVFDRVAAFGLGDCTRATANSRAPLAGCICDEGAPCVHVQTHRHNKSPVPWQLDYLFASDKQMMHRLVSCRVLADDEQAWALSDHCPVVAEFEL